MNSDFPAASAPRQRLLSPDLLLVLAGVIAARAWLLFSTPYMPGMNGAYYLVQARALIERGVLGIPDLPLTFVLHSLLARLLHLVSGLPWDASILYAVKTADSVLPALIVFPIAWTVRSFGGQSEGAAPVPRWLPPLAALTLGISAPLLGMVGDFEKNSVGLAELAFLVWRLAAWMQLPTKRNAGWALFCLGLIGLTHIGVSGTAILLTTCTVGMAMLIGRRDGHSAPRIPWGFIACGAGILLLAGLVVFGFFDPSRVRKLLAAFTHPLDFLQANRPPGRGAGGGPGMPRPGGGPGMGGPGIGGPGMGMGGPPGMPGGGPGGIGIMRFFEPWGRVAAFSLAGGLAVAVAWWKRKSLSVAQIATVFGCASIAVGLTGPWVQGDKMMRFNLMAMAPAVLCAAFVLAQIRQRAAQLVLALALAVAMINTAVPRLMQGGRPILEDAALAELASLKTAVEKPAQTVVAVQHGVEWWTAWFLHTWIVQPQALTTADWSHYEFVWYLQVKSGMQGPLGGGRPPPGMNGRPGFPPERDRRGPGNGGPGGPRMGGGPPMMGPGIPDDSTELYDSEHFRLAWVRTAPENIPVSTASASPAPP